MKMASVFTAFTILTLSIALCSASRTTLFSNDVGEFEGDDQAFVADEFGFNVRDGGYEQEKKRKQGGGDVEATKMSSMDDKVLAFIAKDDNYEPEGKQKRREYDAEAANMRNMDHGDMTMGQIRLRPISVYMHRNHGDMMADYQVRLIRGSSNDGGDMFDVIMGHGLFRQISGNGIDGGSIGIGAGEEIPEGGAGGGN